MGVGLARYHGRPGIRGRKPQNFINFFHIIEPRRQSHLLIQLPVPWHPIESCTVRARARLVNDATDGASAAAAAKEAARSVIAGGDDCRSRREGDSGRRDSVQ